MGFWPRRKEEIMCETETFWTLLRDLPHWEFEIFLILIFDVLIGVMLLPCLKRFVHRHTHIPKINY